MLERDLNSLAEIEHDLVIVGAGIFGACAAWDAALRGLKVAIVDKGDFCSATSANHFKMVHGGLRYLQHLDFFRIRESSRERNTLLRIAPHLIQPLPIVIPTYGHGMKGKGILRAGMFLYDAITLDRNNGILDPDRRIPARRFISRDEILSIFPGIESDNLTGGAVFCDGQIYNPTRLGISFLRSAVLAGAEAANYLEARSFLSKKNRVIGIKARDRFSGSEFEIRGRLVLNTAGPWAHRLLANGLGLQLNPKLNFSRDLALVVRRPLNSKFGIAFSTKTRDADSVLDRGGRHLFALPWRDSTLIGVWHKVFHGPPEKISISQDDLRVFVEEVNEANPSLNLNTDDIAMVNTGLTLFGNKDSQGPQKMSFGKRSRLIDHEREHNIEGLVTLVGVRATMAQGMAQKVIDLVSAKLGFNGPKSMTSVTPIYGGQIDVFEKYLDEIIALHPRLDAGIMRLLQHNYGVRYNAVLKYIDEEPTWAEALGDSSVLKAEVVHAMREEMAQKLSDVVFRRTDLGTAGDPGEDALSECAGLMALEMGWKEEKTKEELQEVRTVFPPFNKKY